MVLSIVSKYLQNRPASSPSIRPSGSEYPLDERRMAEASLRVPWPLPAGPASTLPIRLFERIKVPEQQSFA
jgi:hypothetical protein